MVFYLQGVIALEFYTPEEAAARLKIARRTVYQWLREGKIKGIKLSNLWRIPETELNRLLEGTHDAQKEE
jgi:excisionase family DNA binding protein